MSIKQKNLVSNQVGIAKYVDPLLLNAWGLEFSKDKLWVVANHSGTVQAYDEKGVLQTSVTVPSEETADPTGITKNHSAGFLVNGVASEWLVCTESGTIAAYNATVDATNAFIVVTTEEAVYKGLVEHRGLLYVADFLNAEIDTFDSLYNSVALPFVDPTLPEGYAPFNIAVFKNQIYVLYALQQPPENTDEQACPGCGYISIFDLNGVFVKRFVSQGELNAPWGIVKAPKEFRKFGCKFLVGNFGDGNINEYDKKGNFLGKLKDKNGVLVIDGLWGLTVLCDKVYFAAGPNDEENGLVGYIFSKC